MSGNSVAQRYIHTSRKLYLPTWRDADDWKVFPACPHLAATAHCHHRPCRCLSTTKTNRYIELLPNAAKAIIPWFGAILCSLNTINSPHEVASICLPNLSQSYRSRKSEASTSTMDLEDIAPASIDAVVHASNHEDVSTSQPQSPSPDEAQQLPTKLKGRKRWMHSLQRMSSSPSLARMGRTSSSGYRTGAKASISCVSLASSNSLYAGHSYSSSYSSEFSPQFSTALTSATGSPGPATPTGTEFFRPRTRTVGKDTPTSIGLPHDLRPSSRMGNCMSLEADQDYFSRPFTKSRQPVFKRRGEFQFLG